MKNPKRPKQATAALLKMRQRTVLGDLQRLHLALRRADLSARPELQRQVEALDLEAKHLNRFMSAAGAHRARLC